MGLRLNPRSTSHGLWNVGKSVTVSVPSSIKWGRWQDQLHKVGMRIQQGGMSSGPSSASGTEEMLVNDGPSYCCYSFHSRPGTFWVFSFLPFCSFRGNMVPSGFTHCFCPARHPRWPLLSRFTHILFRTDSGPSEQLPSQLLIQVTRLGTFTSFGLLPCGCQPASS